MDGYTISTPIRVRFAETDAQGIAHNASYFVWFEVARVDYLEQLAGGYPAIREHGIEALVLECHVRYLQPARFDDRLTVHSRVVDLRGARFRFEYAIERDCELVANGWTGHGVVDATSFRPTRVPSWLSESIASAESSRSASSASPSSP
ncbi:MAG TPA: thioesterase family protein [Gaiellaceae bacterium]|jgi:acyl-CoA thioester hydrolase|nr:thioesterase family protein [Gaiellaceae bacterium]